jgi:hypothetical protein
MVYKKRITCRWKIEKKYGKLIVMREGAKPMPEQKEMTMPELNKMTVEELRALIVTLYETIAELKIENETLRASLNKNSQNSSKPPSTDGFNKIPNNREKTGNKPGGVLGHEGHRIELPENYQELIAKGEAVYELADHTGGSKDYVSKWVIDIRVMPVFIEHRFNCGEVPVEYKNDVTYGEEIKALSISLTDDGMVSAERLADFFSSVTNGVVHPTKATLLGFQNELACLLVDEVEAIKTDIRNALIMNVDESPMRCTQTVVREDGAADVYKEAQGKTFNVCTRTYSTPDSTLYTVNPQKDLKGVERDGVLPNYHNTLGHDHDIKFYNYGGRHFECNTHPCRELNGIAEFGIEWAGRMRGFLLGANDYKNNDLDQGIHTCDPVVLDRFEDDYLKLLVEGFSVCDGLNEESYGHKKLTPLVKRLWEYGDEHMLFLHDYAVPFTNNLAERDLRAEKTKQKVSGCFRSWHGIESFVTIRSFISTVKKRGMNLVCSLRAVFKGEGVLV